MKWTLSAHLSALAIVAFTIASTGHAQERRALLIGVTEYDPAIKQVRSLSGPRNDIVLLHRTLREAWGEDAQISVLADSLERSPYGWGASLDGLPTRAAILDAFRHLAETSQQGDEILIYLSGHGSQIPSMTEGDGFDEIFLPSDFQMTVDKESVQIVNHIVDDEIGDAVERITERGAFVWLVIDACHSGTMERTAAAEHTPRLVQIELDNNRRSLVDLNELPDRSVPVNAGLDDDRWLQAPSVEVSAGSNGGFVGFYASTPDQLALETIFPRSIGQAGRQTHGVLTWSLIQAIQSGDVTSYEDLARSVTRQYWALGNTPSMPMFAGDLGRAPMLDLIGTPTFSILARNRALYLDAGQLDGIETGAVLAVYQGSNPDTLPIFYARAIRSALEEARLEIITDDPKRPNQIDVVMTRDHDSPQLPERRWSWLEDRSPGFRAQVVEAPIKFSLQVARPVDGDGVIQTAHSDLVDNIILALAETPPASLPVAIDIVDAGQPADLRLVVQNERLWFVPDLGTLITQGPHQPYSLPIMGLTSEVVAAALRQIGKARNLIRVATAFANTETTDGLRFRLHLEQRPANTLTAGCEPHPVDEPHSVPAEAQAVSGFDLRPMATVRVGHCDRVYLELRNDGDVSLDVSPIYVDPHDNVYYLRGYNRATFSGLRVEPGETRIVSYTENTASGASAITPVGDVELILVAVESDPTSEYVPDFRYLEGSLPSYRTDRASASAPDNLRDLLDDAGFGAGTVRSATTGNATGRAGAIILSIKTFAPGDG